MPHAHVRVQAAELGDEVGAQVVARGRERPDAHGPAAQLAHGEHRLARLLHLLEHRLGVRAQRAARLGQHEPAADAGEQRHAELGLEPPHLFADGRLGEVQRVRGRAEGAAIGGGEEVLELLQIHLKAFPSDHRGK